MMCNLFAVGRPGGFCKNVVEFAQTEATRLGYWTAKNAKDSLYIYVDGVDGKNTEKTIGIAGHIDTLGLMVRSIGADGTLEFVAVGGPIIHTLNGEYCRIYTRDKRAYTGTILNKSPAAHVFRDARTHTTDKGVVFRFI